MWRVNVTENTLKVSQECFNELRKLVEDGYSLGYDFINLKLVLDYDAMEWIDFIPNFVGALDILEKHNAEGVLAFADLEGDYAGSIWGYKFVPGQATKKLTGKIVYIEND